MRRRPAHLGEDHACDTVSSVKSGISVKSGLDPPPQAHSMRATHVREEFGMQSCTRAIACKFGMQSYTPASVPLRASLACNLTPATLPRQSSFEKSLLADTANLCTNIMDFRGFDSKA